MAKHELRETISRTIECRTCGSQDLSKHGKYKENQYYICKTCGRKFSEVDTYPDMKFEKELIIKALTYYYNGMSLKNIVHTFDDLHEVKINKSIKSN